jgi:hypothetical protein
MNKLIQCMCCHGKFKRADIHAVVHTGPVGCKKCHSDAAGKRHLARVAHKKATYKGQQATIKAERKAKLEQEADELMKQVANWNFNSVWFAMLRNEAAGET